VRYVWVSVLRFEALLALLRSDESTLDKDLRGAYSDHLLFRDSDSDCDKIIEHA